MSVAEDAQNITIMSGTNSGKGYHGQVHVGRDLLGLLEIVGGEVSASGPPDAILIDRDVVGQVVVNSALRRNLIVGGSVPANSSVELEGGVASTALVQIGDLPGSLQVTNDAEGSVEVAGAIGETGSLYINGDLRLGGKVQIGDPNDPDSGDVLGLLHITGLVDAAQDPNDARIVIEGDVNANDPNHPAQVLLDGGVGAGLQVDGSIGERGVVDIGGALNSPGWALIGSHLRGAFDVGGNLGSHIWIGGDLSGSIDVGGYLGDPRLPDEAFAGHIRVNGAFGKVVAEDPALIWIHTKYSMDPNQPTGRTSYAAIDYDASGDEWDPEATIAIGESGGYQAYHENTPGMRFWGITQCRGDMNNDSSVDIGDINGFIAALNDPDDYALMFPGLSGSMVLHGDADCNNVFEYADINPFVYRVTTGYCDCPLDFGEDGEGGEQRSPEELAKLLADNVAPELYDGLLYVVSQVIDAQPDDESRAYWVAVYAALTE